MPFEYGPISDIEAQLKLTLDIRDIAAITGKTDKGPVDWMAARGVYESGGNSKRGDGSTRTLVSVANNPKVLAQFPKGEQLFGAPKFLDAHVQAALTGSGHSQGLSAPARRQLLDKGILAILYGEILEELDAAMEKVKIGNVDAAKGAPHNVDEAWAYYAGAKEGNARPYALASTAGKRERNFKIEGKLDEPLQRSLSTALMASQAGQAKAFDEARTQTRGYLNAIFYLASLRYVGNLKDDTTAADREVHLAEAWGFFQTIRPAVAAAAPDAASAVQAVYSKSASQSFTTSDVHTVYQALNNSKVLQALNIPPGLTFQAPVA